MKKIILQACLKAATLKPICAYVDSAVDSVAPYGKNIGKAAKTFLGQ